MTSSAETFFLCCGLPKSGTTFLQRTLNLHPEVSCPSEQDFASIARYVKALARDYQRRLELLDRRTGGQGAPIIDDQVVRQLRKNIILTLSREFAKGKRIHGLKDNMSFTNIRAIHTALERPRVIAIVREPAAIAKSAWRHNRRLAEEEPNLADEHLALLKSPEGTLEGYIRVFCNRYPLLMDPFLSYSRGRSDIHIVQYEEMTADTASALRPVLRFLGADDRDGIIADIVRRSTKQEMAKTSKRPEFFGLG